MVELEGSNHEKESQINQLHQDFNDQMKELDSDRDEHKANSDNESGGYTITLSETPTRRIKDPQHFRTFTPRNEAIQAENFKLSRAVKDLIKVTGKVLSEFKLQADKTEGHENLIERIDKEIEHIMKDQKMMKQTETALQS